MQKAYSPSIFDIKIKAIFRKILNASGLGKIWGKE